MWLCLLAVDQYFSHWYHGFAVARWFYSSWTPNEAIEDRITHTMDTLQRRIFFVAIYILIHNNKHTIYYNKNHIAIIFYL